MYSGSYSVCSSMFINDKVMPYGRHILTSVDYLVIHTWGNTWLGSKFDIYGGPPCLIPRFIHVWMGWLVADVECKEIRASCSGL